MWRWNLTSVLPPTGPNLGIEAIAWMPDSFLTAHGLIDENTGVAYNPSDYPLHGSGLFSIGVESVNTVFVFALNSDETFARISRVAIPLTGVMALEFEPETGHVWAVWTKRVVVTQPSSRSSLEL